MADRPFLTAEWRNLLMVNFAVDPALLAPFVPVGTVLDQHATSTYLSVVAFQFLDTRVLGLRIPFHIAFEELNLRFYVRRQVGSEVRRAVVFIREVVPRRAIALVARLAYNEPYVALPMRHAVAEHARHVLYGWRQDRRWAQLSAVADGPGEVPGPERVETFITEHYWGYARQRSGRTLEYRVEHPRWTVWRARLTERPDFRALYGPQIANALTTPASVFIADGSPVRVFRGELLPR